MTKNWKKKNFDYLFLINNRNLLQGEAFSPQKRTSSNSKKFKLLTFFYVCGSFLPAWIQIQGPHWIQIQSGSGRRSASGSSALVKRNRQARLDQPERSTIAKVINRYVSKLFSSPISKKDLIVISRLILQIYVYNPLILGRTAWIVIDKLINSSNRWFKTIWDRWKYPSATLKSSDAHCW